MKKIIALFSLYYLFLSFGFSTNTSLLQNEGIIEIDLIMTVIADDYSNARSVDITVLDANGNVIASAVTCSGGAVSFTRTGHERKVILNYHMSSGADFIVITDTPI